MCSLVGRVSVEKLLRMILKFDLVQQVLFGLEQATKNLLYVRDRNWKTEKQGFGNIFHWLCIRDLNYVSNKYICDY
jgi:hypothetical protein